MVKKSLFKDEKALFDMKFCGTVEYSDGSKIWYHGGLKHRDHILPAVEWRNGTKYWYRNGVYKKYYETCVGW